MLRGFKFSFHVSLVTAAIIYIYLSTVFVFVDQWFGLRSSPGMMNVAAFTFLAVMCIYSYWLAVFTDPGRVPVSFAPDVEGSEKQIQEIKRKVPFLFLINFSILCTLACVCKCMFLNFQNISLNAFLYFRYYVVTIYFWLSLDCMKSLTS